MDGGVTPGGEAFTYLAERARHLPLPPDALTNADGTVPVPTSEGAEPSPRDDLTLRLVNAAGKLGVLNDTVPVEFLQLIRQWGSPANVTLRVHDGRLEGRLHGYFSNDTAGFALSVQQVP